MASEQENLREQLTSARRRLIKALALVSETDQRRIVLPSGWTIVGLVQHLTLNERYWLRWGVAGQSIPGTTIVNGATQVLLEDYVDVDNEWLVAPHVTAATLRERYRLEGELTDAAIAEVDFDALPGNVDPVWRQWFGLDGADELDNRSIMLHVLLHHAEHAGHLDVAIELLETSPEATAT